MHLLWNFQEGSEEDYMKQDSFSVWAAYKGSHPHPSHREMCHLNMQNDYVNYWAKW